MKNSHIGNSINRSQMWIFNVKFSYRIFNQPSNEDIQWQILIFFRIFNQTFSNIQSPNSHKGYSIFDIRWQIFIYRILNQSFSIEDIQSPNLSEARNCQWEFSVNPRKCHFLIAFSSWQGRRRLWWWQWWWRGWWWRR